MALWFFGIGCIATAEGNSTGHHQLQQKHVAKIIEQGIHNGSSQIRGAFAFHDDIRKFRANKQTMHKKIL